MSVWSVVFENGVWMWEEGELLVGVKLVARESANDDEKNASNRKTESGNEAEKSSDAEAESG